MRQNTIQWWKLIEKPIRGFDDGGEGAGAGQGTPEGEQGSGQGQAGQQGEATSQAAKTYTAEEVAGMKSALEKERAERKTADKELKAFREAQQAREDAEKTEVQRLTDQNAGLGDKYTKLAAGYMQSSIRDAVMAAARAEKFLDPSDAMRPEVLSDLPVEQDADDPTKITLDDAELKRRVKALAKDKPHYLGTTQSGATRSGSTFGGARNQGASPQAESARMATLYPALRGLN